MIFKCESTTSRRKEKWEGKVVEFINHGSHCEVRIESRSGILVVFGKTKQGGFASIPDFGAGCHLVNPRDKFWNTEKLTRVLGKVDGITVASALYALADKVNF